MKWFWPVLACPYMAVLILLWCFLFFGPSLYNRTNIIIWIQTSIDQLHLQNTSTYKASQRDNSTGDAGHRRSKALPPLSATQSSQVSLPHILIQRASTVHAIKVVMFWEAAHWLFSRCYRTKLPCNWEKFPSTTCKIAWHFYKENIIPDLSWRNS